MKNVQPTGQASGQGNGRAENAMEIVAVSKGHYGFDRHRNLPSLEMSNAQTVGADWREPIDLSQLQPLRFFCMEHVTDDPDDLIPRSVGIDAGPINRAEIIGQLPPQDGSGGVGRILTTLCQPGEQGPFRRLEPDAGKSGACSAGQIGHGGAFLGLRGDGIDHHAVAQPQQFRRTALEVDRPTPSAPAPVM